MPTPLEVERQIAFERKQVRGGVEKLRKNTKDLEDKTYASATVYGSVAISAILSDLIIYINNKKDKCTHQSTGQVIKNTTDVTVGVLTVTNTLAVGGTVSIGGTLTYEDVTNIDSVGLITARNGIVVGSGITLSKDGDIFATGISTVKGIHINGTLEGEDLKVGTGVTITRDGDIFATGISTFSEKVLIGTTTEGVGGADELTVANSSSSAGITVRSSTTATGNIYFSDGTSGADEYRGVVRYDHSDNYMSFWTNAN